MTEVIVLVVVVSVLEVVIRVVTVVVVVPLMVVVEPVMVLVLEVVTVFVLVVSVVVVVVHSAFTDVKAMACKAVPQPFQYWSTCTVDALKTLILCLKACGAYPNITPAINPIASAPKTTVRFQVVPLPSS